MITAVSEKLQKLKSFAKRARGLFERDEKPKPPGEAEIEIEFETFDLIEKIARETAAPGLAAIARGDIPSKKMIEDGVLAAKGKLADGVDEMKSATIKLQRQIDELTAQLEVVDVGFGIRDDVVKHLNGKN